MEIGGYKYSKGCIVVGSIDDHDQPNFSIVKEFLVTPIKDILFVCHAIAIITYSRHYHCYEVKKLEDVQILRYKRLCDFHPLTIVTPFTCSGLFVSLKYYLFKSV